MFFGKMFRNFLFFLCVSPLMSFGVTGSITDPGFSEREALKESFFGPLRGSVKARVSRHLRRSGWGDFLSSAHRDNFFDRLFINTDFSLNYPLVEALPSLNSPLLFFVLSYTRPVYDIPEVMRHYCFKSHFCFGEIRAGVSNSFLKGDRLKIRYSVYLDVPVTSKQSLDQRKFLGIGSSLSVDRPFFSRAGFHVSGISSHFFDTAVYGSRYANKTGSRSNSIASVFNQAGLRLSPSGRPFIPVMLTYVSHLLALDYHTDWLQSISLGLSAVWPIGKRAQIVAGLVWGGAVFQKEWTARAKSAKPFNPDETYINGGFVYSF